MVWIGFGVAGVAIVAALLALRHARACEKRQLSIVDQLPHSAIAIFGPDLRCTKVLGASSREAGVQPSDFIGLRAEEIYPGAVGGDLRASCEAAMRGERQAFEFTSPRSDRSFWMQIVPLEEGGEIVGGMVVAQDVTELRRAERSRRLEAGRRQLILDVMNEAYVVMDGDGVVTDWNRAAEQTFGFSADEAIGAWIGDLILPSEDHDELRTLLARPLTPSGAERRFDLRQERTAVHRDGRTFTVELMATLLEVDGARSLHTLMHDITDRKVAESELRQHSDDVEALAEAVGELARSTDSGHARGAICRAAVRVANADAAILFEPDGAGTGLRTTAAEGMDLSGVLLPFTERAGSIAAFTTLEPLFVEDIRGNPAVAQSVFSGSEVISALWTPIHRSPDERAIGVIAVAWTERVAELSERLEQVMNVVAAEAAVAIERAAMLDRLERLARTDGLTGLSNRGSWDDEIARELARVERSGVPLTVAMLDLDRFKEYNDRHGHQAGDRFLKEAAAAWRGVLRETDLLARYGGEEFAVALPGCDATVAAGLVERLRSVTPEGESCSAGIATWDRRESPDELLGRADAALYSAKQAGRDRIVHA